MMHKSLLIPRVPAARQLYWGLEMLVGNAYAIFDVDCVAQLPIYGMFSDILRCGTTVYFR